MTTVLIVDDSAVDRRLASGLLEKAADITATHAEGGREALESVAKQAPDIVVADLQMPGMDGLELVELLRARHAGLPVVLITGQGNESTAVAALQRGAASYVPKSALSRDLVPTVMQVLAVSRASDTSDRLMSLAQSMSWKFELENDPTLIPPLVQLVRQALAGMSACDETGQVQVGVALEEALANAIFHGNLELTEEDLASIGGDMFRGRLTDAAGRRAAESPYCDRRVHAEITIGRGESRFVVRDDGSGFAHGDLRDVDDQLASSERSGRGVAHMRLFMDEVHFNDAGNEVTLVRRRR